MNQSRLAILIVCASLTGCASIVSGTQQSITLETQSWGSPTSAFCTLSNDKGNWTLMTPGSVSVHRSYSDLNVECQSQGLPKVSTNVKSNMKPLTYGNILLGGVIGTSIDTLNGAAYDYPDKVTLELIRSFNSATTLPSIPASTAELAQPLAQGQPASSNTALRITPGVPY